MAAQAKIIYATGRRKSSSARVYLAPVASGEEGGQIVVNTKPMSDYFHAGNQRKVLRPLQLTERLENFNIKVAVAGGGSTGQTDAVAHGIARALQTLEPELRPVLKKAGLLTRDPRVVERKKPGRHKARKRPQFSKR